MSISRYLVNRAVKRNTTIYKLARMMYDRMTFRKSSCTKIFEQRIKKIQPWADKILDLSVRPDVNFLLITVDCLRNDHLSSQGYYRNTMPFLDSWDGFRSPLISSPWTYPSVASLLTGFYPHNHKAVMRGRIKEFNISHLSPLSGNMLTIGEILSLLGYTTYLNSSIDLALQPVKTRFKTSNLNSLVDAEVVVDEFKKWMKQHSRNFCAYLHLKDPHEPITPPREYKDYFGAVKNLNNIDRWSFKKPEEQTGTAFEEFKNNKILLYDNTLRYVDSVINELFEYMERLGLLDSTIVAITADHGEEFWDHNGIESQYFFDVRGYAGVGHGHTVFDELIKVPFFLQGPGVPIRKEENLGSNVDIVPTVLEALGVPNDILFDGKNLFNVENTRLLLSEETIHGYERKALLYGDFKFIYSEGDAIAWLFNTKKDKEENFPIEDESLTNLFKEKLSEITRQKQILWRVA